MTTPLQDASTETLIAAIEANDTEGCKSLAAWSKFELRIEPEKQMMICPVPSPFFNIVMGARLDRDRAEAVIQSVIETYRSRQLPFCWWVGPSTEPDDLGERLSANGCTLAAETTGMALDLRAWNDTHATLDKVTIHEVADIETLRSWARVSTTVFAFPGFAADAWFQAYTVVGFGPGTTIRHFVARRRGHVVGTASLFFAAGVAGIENVTVLPDARRTGIGSALTAAALREARRNEFCIATLFASPHSVGLYHRMGFQTNCTEQCYEWSPTRST